VHGRDAVLNMCWSEFRDYSIALEQEENEKLIMQMNIMAVAFGGSAKQRKQMADTILGKPDATFDAEAFESIMQNLAAAPDSEHATEAKEWAASVFDADDEAFKVK